MYTNPQDDDLIDAGEAARLLGLERATLEFWRWKGKGPKHRVIGTRSVRYLRADVLAFRDANVRTSSQTAQEPHAAGLEAARAARATA